MYVIFDLLAVSNNNSSSSMSSSSNLGIGSISKSTNSTSQKPALQLRDTGDGGVEVVGVQFVEVKCPNQICSILEDASMLRLSSTTNCNET